MVITVILFLVMLQLPIYLDHNATTPCDLRVLEALLPYFSSAFGNAASRNHSFGWQAKAAVDLGRERVAALIGSEPGEIIFTSGATEACNLALKGIMEMYAGTGNHIITCSTEHKAVLDTCAHLEKSGISVTYLPVSPEGHINLPELEAAIQPGTVLIALMYANNESGTIHPVEEISSIAHKHNKIFFTDATQAVGKIPVDVNRDGIDLMAFSAHKLYGPKGVGALYVRRKGPRVRLTAQIDGGGHEKGIRSGTLNVPGIVGFGKACELAAQEMPAEMERLSRLRDRLENGLLRNGGRVNGDPLHRLPHTTNISFHGADAEALIMSINKDIAVSTGSACSSATLAPSHVLKAMGLSDGTAGAAVRFGLGRGTSSEEIDYTIHRFATALEQLKQFTGQQ